MPHTTRRKQITHAIYLIYRFNMDTFLFASEDCFVFCVSEYLCVCMSVRDVAEHGNGEGLLNKRNKEKQIQKKHDQCFFGFFFCSDHFSRFFCCCCCSIWSGKHLGKENKYKKKTHNFDHRFSKYVWFFSNAQNH